MTVTLAQSPTWQSHSSALKGGRGACPGASIATRPALLPNQVPYTPALPLGRGASKRKEALKTSKLDLPQVLEEPRS